MAELGRGLGSMAPARMPGAPQSQMMQITPPMYGPNAPEPQTPGEQPMFEEKEISAVEKLIGQFNYEIDLADQGRRAKEWKWIKIDKYMAGKDVQDPPDGYEESTFFYRRLPRIIQIGKAKLFKNVCPIHDKPWDVRPSPRHNQNVDQEEQNAIVSKLREDIEDIHEAMELENSMDDMCEHMSWLGGAVSYGPIRLQEPRTRWQDGKETIEPGDEVKPMWTFYDPRRVYPDPSGQKAQELEYVHFYNTWSAHQIRSLQDDPTFIKEELAELLKDLPHGNWSGNMKRWETSPFPNSINNTAMNRYMVWMRVGVLTAEALEDLGEKFPSIKDLDKDQVKLLTDSMWEIYFCDKHILKIAKRVFQPRKMPVQFIPFRRDPTSIFGIGAGEAALECVEMLINISRSIDDALADTSGFQVSIDAGRIENKDLKVKGRKTWIHRSKGRKDEPQGKAVEFFTVPSNLEHLLACFKLFESMIPICTGISEATTGLDMGSGIRTDSMMSEVWSSLEEFLRDTVGNVDRYWWKPHLRDTYQWIRQFYPDWQNVKIEADLQVQGVRGALRREIVGRKVQDFYLKAKQFGLSDWADEIELVRAISAGMGIEDEKSVLTPKQYVEKKGLEAKQKELDSRAGRVAEDQAKDKERAHTSSRDAVLETLKTTLTANPQSPLLPVLYEEMFKLTGELSPRASAGLSILSKLLAEQYRQQGMATDQEAQVLSSPVQAANPLELAPDSRDPQQAAEAAQSGQAPKTPPNSPPPMPTAQQVVGAPPAQ